MKAYYEELLVNAKKTLEKLEHKLFEIRESLRENPINAEKMREFRNINLDITITLNEIENCEEQLELIKQQENFKKLG